MKLNKIATMALTALISIGASAAQKQSILNVKESIIDNNIVYPESFETNTKEMMNNWYLQNYTTLDTDVELRDAATVGDAEYTKRLAAIPSAIELPYNQVVRSYIERYVTRNRTLVEEMLGMSLYYMPIFEQALEAEQLPLELKYLPVIESALNPNAVSRAGAAGLWQFMIATGKGQGLEVNSLVDERRDPYKSSVAAAKYLKDLFKIYNDWSLAIAAYNCGPANVNKALRRAGNTGNGKKKDFWDIYTYLPRETRGYVPAFIAANYVMTYFKRHNISPTLAKKPLITDTVTVNRYVNLNQISSVLNIPIEEIRVLNPQYRRDVIPGNSRPYTLTLPSQQVYSYIMTEDSIINYRSDLYAKREVVEPVEDRVSNDDSEYTWETKQVTSYHKVRKGEKLGTIARRYGLTSNQLKAMNGLKSNSVYRGQTLKIVTTKKVKVPKPQDRQEPEQEQLDEPTMATATAPAAENRAPVTEHQEATNTPYKGSYSISNEPEQKEVPSQTQVARERNSKYNASSQNTKKQTREKTYKSSRSSVTTAETEHVVKKGENLTEIARKNGVTIDELKQANNIKGDQINAGSTLKIPGKQTTGKKRRR